MSERPAWYARARISHQMLHEWLVKREPELAAFWDGNYYALHTKLVWPGEREADIVLELRNVNGERRSIAYNLTEITVESAPDKERV